MRNNTYINSFFVEANKFKREGIFLDKDYIKQLDIKRKCIETAKELTPNFFTIVLIFLPP